MRTQTQSTKTRALAALCAALSALGVLGCVSQAVDDQAAEQLAESRADTESAMVWPSCYDGRSLGMSCGLLTRRFSEPDFLESFRERHCKGQPPEACQARYERMLTAQMDQRYYAADMGAVTRTCDANPGKCDKPTDYELLVLDAHNAEIRRRGLHEEIRIEQERQNAQRRHFDTMTGIAGEVLYEAHDGPKCRSYPNVFGGMNTTCTPARAASP